VLPLPEILTTTRLRLRCPVAADASTIFRSYTQDLEVCRFMIWRPHASESVTEEFLASCIKEWKTGTRLAYVITELHANVAIGMLEARTQGTTVDIGYVLARSHWGKGFMPEAIQALTGAALRSSSVFRVQATCDTENIPSQRALEKSGFSREGRLERYTVHPNISSEPRACFMYAKCRQGENAL
jgi:[ribosomal protein S5]-alanine N-acetyltransferase